MEEFEKCIACCVAPFVGRTNKVTGPNKNVGAHGLFVMRIGKGSTTTHFSQLTRGKYKFYSTLRGS